MTTYAASVTIVDLPVGGAVTGAELFEAVQTTNGVGQSVQLSASQIIAFGGVSFLKSVGTALATAGSTTSMVAFVANGGIGSTQLAANAVQRTNITSGAIGSSQLGAFSVVSNAIATGAIGSTQLGALAVQQSNITSAAIGSSQLGALAVQQSNITAAAVGSTQIANFAVTAAQIQTAAIGTSQVVTGAIGMTLLNTLTPNGVASATDTTSITSTFSNYFISLSNVSPSTNTTFLRMQVATSGTSWITAGYNGLISVVNVVNQTDATSLILTGTSSTTSSSNSPSNGINGFLYLHNPAQSGTSNKAISGVVSYLSSPGSFLIANPGGNTAQSTALSSINFLFSSGNIATGTIKIYGMY